MQQDTNPPKKSLLTRYAIAFGIGLVLTAGYSLAKDYSYEDDPGKTPDKVDYRKPQAVKKVDHGDKYSLRFGLFGDWGQDSTVHSLVADGLFVWQKTLAKRRRGLNAVLLAGDNFYSKGVKGLQDPKWEKLWGKPYRRVGVPFYASLGNHDYGYGAENAQYQVEKSGTPGYKLWNVRDANGPKTPGIYYDQWFQSKTFACQVVFIDTNLLLVSKMRRTNMWPKQLQWLSDRLSDAPPKGSDGKTIVRFVIGHHLVRCFGEKESEIEYINSDKGRQGPDNTTLRDILIKKATAYLCGHAHTVEYINIADKKVIPKSGPIHGKTRILEAQTPIQIVSGTGANVRQKSYWADSCYYVARIPGFTTLTLTKTKKGKARLCVSFVDCRRRKRPTIIYSLVMPLENREATAESKKAH